MNSFGDEFRFYIEISIEQLDRVLKRLRGREKKQTFLDINCGIFPTNIRDDFFKLRSCM